MICGMGLFRKMTSFSTMGLVDFRSDKERIAKYTRQTRNAARKQAKQAAAAPYPVAVVTPQPQVPPGAPAAQWNGTVWQSWNAAANRWMIWDGQAWR